MIDSVLFIGSAIIAIVQLIKFYAPKVNGGITIIVAALVGIVVALVDVQIGVANISIAQGIMTGLAAAGVTTVASKIAVPVLPTVVRK
jgi:hypothetical protein